MAEDFNISIGESEKAGVTSITLSGNLTIDNALSIHETLSDKIVADETINISIENANDIDLSIVQMLVGFTDTRNKLDKTTHTTFNISEDILELMEKSGVIKLISLLEKTN